MSTWQDDMQKGFRLLGDAIIVAVEAEEERAETYPGQIRGMLRLLELNRRGVVQIGGHPYVGAPVRVFDELTRETHDGMVVKVWNPGRYTLCKVKDSSGDMDWFPAPNCTVLL